jgi:hypothetical protein
MPMPDPAPIACFSSTYQLFKDFAQPIATTIGAITVAGITTYFARIQARIAKNQVGIARFQSELAHDRLRFDLFNKRYEIYDAVKILLKTIFDHDWTPNSDRTKVYDLMRIIDEAIFFFSDDEAAVFAQISHVVENYLIAQKALSNGIADEYTRARVVGEFTQHKKDLRDYQRNLPMNFAKALSFPTLEGRTPPV